MIERSLMDVDDDDCGRPSMDAISLMEDGLNDLIDSTLIRDVPVMRRRDEHNDVSGQ